MSKNVKHCSFCGRSDAEVEFMILGQDGVQICNECAIQAAEIVRESTRKTESTHLNIEKIPKPKEIKQYLDQYVISQEEQKNISHWLFQSL